MGAVTSARRMIDTRGEAMTLKRAGETDLPVMGKRLTGSIEDAGGSAARQSFRIKLSTTQLAASAWVSKVVTRKDSIVVGTRTCTIENAEPINDSGETALWFLEVVG